MPAAPLEDFTVGVEEEFFLVDVESGALRTDATDIVQRAEPPDGQLIERELKRSQVETGSAVCVGLDDLHRSLTGLRAELDRTAAEVGARILATGTHPTAHWIGDGGVTPAPSYELLLDIYGLLTDEQVVCGCHIHVGVLDPHLAIDVMNRCRSWVPVLIALSANSPYWLGRDTAYASYRTEIFHRWPTAGIPEHFADRADYESVVEQLRETEAIDTPARLYWDIRPSVRYPTLEFRASDTCLTVDESVMVAGLVRALVETMHADAVAGRPCPRPRPELLRAALWRAARFGLSDGLIDVDQHQLRPASEVLGTLVDLVRPALEARGDWPAVSATLDRIRRDGTGADRQRRLHAEADTSADLVRRLRHAAGSTIDSP